MESKISIKPEIRIINGKRKYYYGNVGFDSPEAFDEYVQGLNPAQTIQDIISTFDPKIHTKECAGLNNQCKTNEIQDLY